MNTRPARFSLAGKLALQVGVVNVVMALAAAGASALTDDTWLVLMATLLVGLPAGFFMLHLFLRPLRHALQSVADGVTSLEDRDFNFRLAEIRNDELGDIIGIYNRVGSVLRQERIDLKEREALLESVLQTTPTAVLLVSDNARISLANRAARQLFTGGLPLEGRKLDEIGERVPRELSDAINSSGDALVTIEHEGRDETLHVTSRGFLLNQRSHRLLLIARLSNEIRRREVEVWKRVIRTVSHELNNSLAPLRSLAHSGKVALGQEGGQARLAEILGIINERISHLTLFIGGYAEFARLPAPRLADHPWRGFFETLAGVCQFRIVGEVPNSSARIDASQMHQALANLVKNAHESGSEPEDVAIEVAPLPAGGTRISVLDRGQGMEGEVLRNALLPFYSTKESGTGLGLPLCREIIEAHGGRMRIASRKGGGTRVVCEIPGPGARA